MPASESTNGRTRDWQAVASLVKAPQFMLPWLDRFYEPADCELMDAVADEPLSARALRSKLSEGGSETSSLATFKARLERAYRRAVLDRSARGRYSPSHFAERFEAWVLWEGWQDVPEEVRDEVREWAISAYVERKRPYVERALAGGVIEPVENETYLLLDEVEEILRRQEHIYVMPCDCRAIMDRCNKPTLNCLRFPEANWRGLGWEISVERAVEIARESNRRGLMQTGSEPGAPGGAICNCCSDCCFPHLVAERLGSAKVWPRSRYVARIDNDACDGCNRCVPRCPFQAIARAAKPDSTDAAAGSAAGVTIDAEQCRGCGLCSTGCPSEAIHMEPLASIPSP